MRLIVRRFLLFVCDFGFITATACVGDCVHCLCEYLKISTQDQIATQKVLSVHVQSAPNIWQYATDELNSSTADIITNRSHTIYTTDTSSNSNWSALLSTYSLSSFLQRFVFWFSEVFFFFFFFFWFRPSSFSSFKQRMSLKIIKYFVIWSLISVHCTID